LKSGKVLHGLCMDRLTSHAMTDCIRCGTCCRNGGPVLHREDMDTLRNHHAEYAHLMTIRKGELTHNPVSNRLEHACEEMVKVAGKEDSWSCYFYREEDNSCGIYDHRFLECRLLKCWQPAEVIGIIGQRTICRSDIINHNDPVMDVIAMHERECSLQELQLLIDEASFGKGKAKALKKLSGLVQRDEAIRSYAFSDLRLRRDYELFIFGRPLTNILKDFGFAVKAAR
jgi:Fe-S-cluster containining protein